MKNLFFTSTIALAAMLISSCGNGTSTKNNDSMDMNNHEDHDKMKKEVMDNPVMKSMSGTMALMEGMNMSGDFDLDFASMMILHHQAAIDMSKEEMAKGTDAWVRTMAQKIITAQQAEIAEMQQFVDSYKPTVSAQNVEKHNELHEAMKKMMDQMHAIKLSGNTDRDYVSLMIPHHESAVAMANDEISHGKQSKLKIMAQKMVADQTREIQEFKVFLAGK